MARSATNPKPAHRPLVAAFLTLLAVTGSKVMQVARAPRSLRYDTAAQISGSALGALVLFIIGSFLAALLAIQVLADILPDYFTSLGSIFTSLSAVNTTGWPPIVATIFGFLPLVLGVVAVAALFGAGALISLNLRKKGA